jgi:tight adherence protein C
MSGGLLGLAVLAGLALVAAGVPVRRRPRLPDRLGPYVADPARLGKSGTVGRPVLVRLVAVADRVLGGGESVRHRLALLSDGRTVADVRVEQLAYGTGGLVAGAVAGAALTVATGRSPAALLLAVAGSLAGAVGRDVALTRRVRRRQAAVLAEFPVVAELLALAVTAGEGPVGAVDRVCRLTGGALATDLGAALAKVRAGAPLAAALEDLRNRAAVPVLARFVDGMLVALERGTPLADVLRAQAADVREAGRLGLLEAGGRREIGMLVPVVFGILPTTVLFALYPGLVAVSALAGG